MHVVEFLRLRVLVLTSRKLVQQFCIDVKGRTFQSKLKQVDAGGMCSTVVSGAIFWTEGQVKVFLQVRCHVFDIRSLLKWISPLRTKGRSSQSVCLQSSEAVADRPNQRTRQWGGRGLARAARVGSHCLSRLLATNIFLFLSQLFRMSGVTKTSIHDVTFAENVWVPK